ncbi:flagellin [Hydrogenophaga sp.]|uniref:flagellin N-terminal helical domain-containing protein n=1 Tax=Hydrogenophaga sp. TaxID=1904254 RepID=UPI0027319A80|nr:flagellin [Hydrogenophaga sp.]MDP2016436.1 flagellin [Hydrogenophaga sp.]MDP3166193.1 flagellin [Hydrogenophaga sp.]MDP3812308.1 flagellin [Hydrogenophaga sp.]
MTTINTNVMSMTAQRNLTQSAGSLATSMQRLSSGLRVNSAKDDAAGLAISERMNAQVRGLNVAARNANDGISLAQTAEGALGKVGDMLQRMRELAVQSSNATNNQTDRNALDAEVTALKDEIGRVAGSTKFNGTSLLDGSFSSQAFQVGANAGETITVSAIADVTLANLGGTTNIATTSVAASGLTGFATAIPAGGVTINGIDIGVVSAAGSAGERANQMVSAINKVSAQSNVGASYDAATGQISLRSTSGSIVVAGASATVPIAGFAAGTTAAVATTGIAGLNVQSFNNSQTALVQIDKALEGVNTSRANLGALQSRFENAVSSIQITAENTAAARGRIVDADFAKETSNLSRSQILQQAGTAMVAQANQAPQGVLALLR